MADKEGVSAEISALIGTPPRPTSRGGTITRPFLEDVAGILGVDSSGLDKVQLTRALVQAVGQPWDSSCASAHTDSGGGGNITRVALDRLLQGLRTRFPVELEPSTIPAGLETPAPTTSDLAWREHFAEVGLEMEADGHLDVSSLTDERWRTFSSIVQRRGQSAFRRRLLRAYGSTCAMTGCDAAAALEAAHVIPYLGEQTNRTENGILLRADVHTLFDLGLIGIHPATRQLVLDEQLMGTAYENLAGIPLRATQRAADAVAREALEWRAENIGPAAARVG